MGKVNQWKLMVPILFIAVVVINASGCSNTPKTSNKNEPQIEAHASTTNTNTTQPAPLIKVIHISPKPLTQGPYIVLDSPKVNDTFTEGSFINISGRIIGKTDFSKKITVALWWGWGGMYKHTAGAVNQQEYAIDSDGTFKVKLEIPKGSLAKTKGAQFDLNVSYPGTTSANIAIEHDTASK